MSRLFDWDPTVYTVLVGEMDDQHKVLIGMMNELHARFEAGAAHAVLQRILDRLADYTVRHFREEEQYLEAIDYPQLADHKAIHQRLLGTLLDNKARFDAGGDLTPDFFAFLKNWLASHIRGVDKQYGRFAQRTKVS